MTMLPGIEVVAGDVVENAPPAPGTFYELWAWNGVYWSNRTPELTVGSGWNSMQAVYARLEQRPLARCWTHYKIVKVTL
jgi:hypothetical protein